MVVFCFLDYYQTSAILVKRLNINFLNTSDGTRTRDLVSDSHSSTPLLYGSILQLYKFLFISIIFIIYFALYLRVIKARNGNTVLFQWFSPSMETLRFLPISFSRFVERHPYLRPSNLEQGISLFYVTFFKEARTSQPQYPLKPVSRDSNPIFPLQRRVYQFSFSG